MGNQTPFRPDELMAPPMQGTAFVHFLRRERDAEVPRGPAFHPGALSRRAHDGSGVDVGEGPVSVTGATALPTRRAPSTSRPTTSRCGRTWLRRMVDVEGKDTVADLTDWTTPAYEELWFRFGEGIGLSRGEVLEWPQFTRTFFSMRTLMTYSRYWDWTWLDGIATWYAADLYWREHYGAARQALSTKYGVADHALEFFDVLLEDVNSHVSWEEEGLAYWACTTGAQLTAARPSANVWTSNINCCWR